MNRLLVVFFLVFAVSCSSEKKVETENTENTNSDSISINNKTDELIKGERIDGPANVRDTINGRVLFELYDNVLVDLSHEQYNWFELGVFVKLTEEQFENSKILPSQYLINGTDTVGITKDTVEVMMTGMNDDDGLITGYTYKENIQERTVPEIVLSNLIESKILSKESFVEFMNDFRFQFYDSLQQQPDIKQYFIYESLMFDMSPRDRITLLFQNEKLIGVIHSRNIQLKGFDTVDLIRGHKLSTTSELSGDIVKSIREEKIRFYGMVD